MADVAGIDACKNGWIVVERCSEGWRAFHIRTLSEALVLGYGVVAVDIPIGLPKLGRARLCDHMARKRVRSNGSIFGVPARIVWEQPDQAAASRFSKEAGGAGISTQSWALRPKILEVDDFLAAACPESLSVLHEVHPEVCFYELFEGKAPAFGKGSATGAFDRMRMLEGRTGMRMAELATQTGGHGRLDDLLDAAVACWTADRIAAGTARFIPESEPVDLSERNRPMRMWF